MSDEMDNVEWLRKSSSDEWCASALNKCADEIERLREENAQLKDSLVHVSGLAAVYRSEDFNLRKERDAMREENARLRKAVKAAYYEGWQDNASIDDTEDRLHAEWEHSEACAAIREGGKNG